MRACFRFKSTKSAIYERFELILDEKLSTSFASSLKKDPSITSDPSESQEYLNAKLQSKFNDTKFKQKYQKEIAYANSESRLRLLHDRRAIDPYSTKPWSGSELVHETAQRLIIDSLPPAKKMNFSSSKPIITPNVSLADRILNAKDQSLDYKVGKALTPQEKQNKEFHDLYKERLLGPSMFLNSASHASTIGLASSMADVRISAEIDPKTGTFRSNDMASVRGKPLDKERLANSRDTAYFMNEIIKKQDCLPLWIENQRSVDLEVSKFRQSIQSSVFKALNTILDPDGTRTLQDLLILLPSMNHKKYKLDVLQMVEKSQKDYFSAKIAEINSKIRTYNLLSPSSSQHKWKLVLDTEILSQIDELFDGLEEKLIKDKSTRSQQKQKQSIGSPHLLNIFGGKETQNRHVHSGSYTRPGEPLNFWRLFKQIFKSE